MPLEQQMKKLIKKHQNPITTSQTKNQNLNFLLLDAVTKDKIKFIIVYNNNLNSRKTAGPNFIPIPILTIIINISFQTGIYPEQCKIAPTTPIFKKGDKLDIQLKLQTYFTLIYYK